MAYEECGRRIIVLTCKQHLVLGEFEKLELARIVKGVRIQTTYIQYSKLYLRTRFDALQ